MSITTLIPAYKPQYLNDLLVALRYQSVKPERIIFSDDSPQQAFVAALNSEPLKSTLVDLRVEVVAGPRAGAYANCRHLLQTWNGSSELVHFLLDDDVIYPDFYARHLAAHATGQYECTISRRWTALESGQPVAELPRPLALAQHPHRLVSIDADVAFTTTLPFCNNWFGELSNAVFHRDLRAAIDTAQLADISFAGLEDIGSFLCAALRRPVGYLNDSLGFFRVSPGQNTQQVQGRQMKLAYLAWIALTLAAQRLGKLTREQTVEGLTRAAHLILTHYQHTADMAAFCELLPALVALQPAAIEHFLKLWDEFNGRR